MRDIFYFSSKIINLAEIEQFIDEIYGYYCFLNASQDALEVRIEDETIQILTLNIEDDFGDTEDVEVIRNTGVVSGICISHHIHTLDQVKEILQTLLEKYGGWVGNDWDGFEPRFTLSNIHRFEYPY